MTEILSVVPPERRLLVTNHDALGHFADRYDFEILGTVLPGASTLARHRPPSSSTSPTTSRQPGVPAIFAEALESTDEATTLAERLGVDVVTLYTDSLGEDGSGAETYADLMRFDATAIADALADDVPHRSVGVVGRAVHRQRVHAHDAVGGAADRRCARRSSAPGSCCAA